MNTSTAPGLHLTGRTLPVTFREHLDADVAAPALSRARLEVYVAAHCPTCVESRALACAAAERFPDVEVALIDLEAGGTPPEPVVAVPTYLLNGRVLWLGNPAPEELFARLAAAVE